MTCGGIGDGQDMQDRGELPAAGICVLSLFDGIGGEPPLADLHVVMRRAAVRLTNQQQQLASCQQSHACRWSIQLAAHAQCVAPRRLLLDLRGGDICEVTTGMMCRRDRGFERAGCEGAYAVHLREG